MSQKKKNYRLKTIIRTFDQYTFQRVYQIRLSYLPILKKSQIKFNRRSPRK